MPPLEDAQIRQQNAQVESWARLLRSAERFLSDAPFDKPRLVWYQDKIASIQESIESHQSRFPDSTTMLAYVENIAEKIKYLLSQQQASSIQGWLKPWQLEDTEGRPRIKISYDFLKEAIDLHYLSLRGIHDMLIDMGLEISSRTIRRQILAYGLRDPFQRTSSLDNTFLSDESLTAMVHQAKILSPDCGAEYIRGFIRSCGFHITRERIRQMHNHLYPFSSGMQGGSVQRRTYVSRGPNAVWHNDGLLALVFYGIVVHIFVDGYSRLIVGLRAATDNRGRTVLNLFNDAVSERGLPSRCRGDRGRENIETATEMNMRRGLNRGSYMFGTSTHNTRAERQWLDVRAKVVNRWYSFFKQLEATEDLDIDSSLHKWLLQFLFLAQINTELDTYRQSWNHHTLSTEGRSPEQLFFTGMHTHGVRGLFMDEHADDFDPNEGIDGNVDENDEAYRLEKEEMAGAVVHPAVSPFGSEDAYQHFLRLTEERRLLNTNPSVRWLAGLDLLHETLTAFEEDIEIGFVL